MMGGTLVNIEELDRVDYLKREFCGGERYVYGCDPFEDFLYLWRTEENMRDEHPYDNRGDNEACLAERVLIEEHIVPFHVRLLCYLHCYRHQQTVAHSECYPGQQQCQYHQYGIGDIYGSGSGYP